MIIPIKRKGDDFYDAVIVGDDAILDWNDPSGRLKVTERNGNVKYFKKEDVGTITSDRPK